MNFWLYKCKKYNITSTLKELDLVSSRSKIYTEKYKRKNIYKIFSSIDSIDNASALIEEKKETKGIKMRIVLNDFFRCNFPNIYLYVLLNVLKDMQRIHSLDGKPVMHFNNLLVDIYFRHYFIDIYGW